MQLVGNPLGCLWQGTESPGEPIYSVPQAPGSSTELGHLSSPVRTRQTDLESVLLDMVLVNSSIKFLFIFSGNFPFMYSLFSVCTDL